MVEKVHSFYLISSVGEYQFLGCRIKGIVLMTSEADQVLLLPRFSACILQQSSQNIAIDAVT